jgi:predicted  nucleic acid-binding Zn-ribbon protein
MELMEFAFADNIAKALLRVQQAKAKVEARKTIVKGSVLIIRDALHRLKEEEVELKEELQQKLIKDLLVITCSERGAPKPVIRL